MRAWFVAALLLTLLAFTPVGTASTCGSGTQGASYTVVTPREAVHEAEGTEIQVVVERTGDTSCTAVANIRVVEGELDFEGATSFRLTMNPGSQRASEYLTVRDDGHAEPLEEFEVVGDLQVSGGGQTYDYPGYLQGRISIQASDGYTSSTLPRIAFIDEARTNRTTLVENSSWYPKFAITFAPLDDVKVTLDFDNGTCGECRVFSSRFLVKAGQRTITLLGKNTPEIWAPDDNRSEPPEAACVRILAPGMRTGNPRAIIVIDDDNRTRVPLGNRTLLQRAGLTNETIDHLMNPCAKSATTGRATSQPSIAPSGTGTRGATEAGTRSDGGVPADSPLLQPKPAPAPFAAGLVSLAALAGLAARRRRA